MLNTKMLYRGTPLSSPLFPRTVSRLAAVQATFQKLLRPDMSIANIVQDFVLYRFTPEGYTLFEGEQVNIDQDFFTFIALGANESWGNIENIIVNALPSGWSMDQMENTTRAIFRCAGFEIQQCPSTPKGVILNEYIMAAHCFLLDKGHGLINAVLEKTFDVFRAPAQEAGMQHSFMDPVDCPLAP